MKDTQQAISILQAYINSQQPLLDIMKEAVALIKGDYKEALKTGDLKIANDTITSLQSEKESMLQSITDRENQIKELQTVSLSDSNPIQKEVMGKTNEL